MDFSHTLQINSQGEVVQFGNEFQRILQCLPKESAWRTFLYKYQGIWYYPKSLEALLFTQEHFQAKATDVVVVTTPKAGTTWLKALVFAITKRNRYVVSDPNHPILTTNSHELVPFFEFMYRHNNIPDLPNQPCSRLFSTHSGFNLLPDSVKNTSCRIIYLCRNPKDNFVSLWHFMNKAVAECDTEPLIPLEEAFELYCKGIHGFGPIWNHALEYWKLSLQRPDQVLFLKYEDMMGDTTSQIKRIAEFSGCPFSLKEESEGVIDQVIKMCSFENLSNLEVNKNGKRVVPFIENKNYFRKGEVGDWINYLSPSMVEQLDQVVEKKLHGSGLTLS
ncbi:hypothetical protein IFM89_012564 [Coptis chinensis]|uniref:Sulfotransferase n=1 Tax=Coptis chinensis TaxID=261450 RepID=A0A835LEW4_9MAGN|nr:hypothetical protein IFM89_012564 [Coptis chinensis]